MTQKGYTLFINALFEHVEIAQIEAILESIEDAHPYRRQCALCGQDEIPVGDDGEDGWIPVHLTWCPVGMMLAHMMWRVQLVEENVSVP